MKIAVFGKTGQVAKELQRRKPEGVTLQVIDRDQVDFSDPHSVAAVAGELRVDAVINAVAYTAVDKAEDETDLADTINGDAVTALGRALCVKQVPLIHISTDYVFPGNGDQAWHPNAPTAPTSAYGKSKLLGETGLASLAFPKAVLRTSWVFSAHGNNFVKTMLKYGAERSELKVVSDQIGGPTPALGIADACFGIARALKAGHSGGTYHFSGAPDVSWADFAREIMSQASLPAQVTDIPTSDYPTPAKRPLNSRLDCTSLETEFGISRPDWRQGLREVLKELSH